MPSVETSRLILRPFTRDDLDWLSLLNSDADVMRYITGGLPLGRAQTESRLRFILDHWDRHGFGLWAVSHKERRAIIGFCGLQFLDNTTEVEVGYRLARAYWGAGLATEGARASLEHGFGEMGLDRIVAVVHPENRASQRVVEKVGLRYEKDARYYNADLKYYAISRAEYKG